MRILAKEHGIIAGQEIGESINKLLASYSDDKSDKVLELESGTYFIDVDNCPERIFHVTNTTAESEYDDPNQKWRRRVALLFERIYNLKVEGNGAVFIISGTCDNMAFSECENVTVSGIEIKNDKPNAHRLLTTKRTLTTLELTPDKKEEVVVEDGKIYFVGKDYKYPLMHKSNLRHFNSSDACDPDYFTRIAHPLALARKIKYCDGKIIAKGFFPSCKFKVDRDYYFYDNYRKNVGVFVENCNNFKLTDFSMHFSASLSVVCQNCENLTFERIDLSPEKDSTFKLASVADFLHLSSCRGQITVRDSHFSSSGDDVLNVHGVHFIINSIENDVINVQFRHSQAYGFNIFKEGDKLAIINVNTLLQEDDAIVKSAEMIDLYTIRLTLEKPLIKKFMGYAVENVSACPDVLFERNKFERISTRGLLFTTRGKVIIRDNDFNFTKLWAIEIADDARDWYESGMVTDVTIHNNRFHRCTQEYVHIFPHNLFHKGYVHNNVTIQNNEFHLGKRTCYILRSVGNVKISGNKYYNRRKLIKTSIALNAEVVEKDF